MPVIATAIVMLVGQLRAQGQLSRRDGVGQAGGAQLPVEWLVGGETCLLPMHDQPIQFAAGIGRRLMNGFNRLPLTTGMACTFVRVRRRNRVNSASPNSSRGPPHSSAVLALEGGIVADEIAEALRHAGDHLLVALSLVHPAVDL